MLAPDLAQYAAAIGFADLDQIAEGVEGRRDIAGLLGDDDELIILAIVGERDAEPVENSPAQRRQQPKVHSVLVGEDRVSIRIQDLQLVHSSGERHEQHRLTARDDSPRGG